MAPSAESSRSPASARRPGDRLRQVIYYDGGTDALVRGVRPQQVFLRYRPSEVVAMGQASRRGGIVPGDDST